MFFGMLINYHFRKKFYFLKVGNLIKNRVIDIKTLKLFFWCFCVEYKRLLTKLI